MKHFLMMVMVATIALGCGSSKQSDQTNFGTITTLTVDEFSKVIKKKNVRLIDVRTPKEYAEGHIAGADNIDVKAANFADQIKEVKGSVAVYCVKGVRSMKAATQLAAQGCTVYNLDGGITAWKQAGKSITH